MDAKHRAREIFSHIRQDGYEFQNSVLSELRRLMIEDRQNKINISASEAELAKQAISELELA